VITRLVFYIFLIIFDVSRTTVNFLTTRRRHTVIIIMCVRTTLRVVPYRNRTNAHERVLVARICTSNIKRCVHAQHWPTSRTLFGNRESGLLRIHATTYFRRGSVSGGEKKNISHVKNTRYSYKKRNIYASRKRYGRLPIGLTGIYILWQLSRKACSVANQ